jgi:alpha-D-xyloside xylohydrolase
MKRARFDDTSRQLKKMVVTLAVILMTQLNAMAYQKTTSGVVTNLQSMNVEVQFLSPDIVRILKSPDDLTLDKQSLSVVKTPESVDLTIWDDNRVATLKSTSLTVELDLRTGKVTFTDPKGRQLLMEKDYGTQFTPFDDAGNPTYTVRQAYMLDAEEAIYGLGQQQTGKMNQRGQKLLLRQANMTICIPYIQSVKGYGLFWDNYSPTTFTDNKQEMSFESQVGECSDYYFLYGGDGDGVVSRMRDLTGQAPMLPLWAFGFLQSRERYTSQKQTVGVVEAYRKLGVPLDGIIQDWQYWSTDNAYWNAMEFGNPEFPDPIGMIDQVHKLNAHIMISVWASFGPRTKPYSDMDSKGMLMTFDTWPRKVGVKPYDPFHPEARDIYWKYLNEGIFSKGMDAWWLDSTEPDHFDITEKDFDNKTHLGSFRSVRNAFPLMTVKGVYEHQRATTSDKRVFILTRSAFAGQQRYAANSWSGDVTSSWKTLRKQIPAGLNFSICGIPYWNTDIGGFFSGRNFREGVKDKTFHELYVRWMQFATFTPMMRSHGTDTPREIYQFGQRGDWSFDAQEKFIHLRYRLLPYLYSTAWDITSHSGSMMRPLFMDFAHDPFVLEMDDQYLFGKAFMVAPVTEPMYVSLKEGKTTEDFSQSGHREVYLPEGVDWIDFWTGEKMIGGKRINASAPIDIMPLYVRAGSIVPWGPDVQYSDEKNWDKLEIRIYPGANGTFTLYEDEKDTYNYENGAYSTITFNWDDDNRQLIIEDRKGQFSGMLKTRSFHLVVVDEGVGTGVTESLIISKKVVYKGKRVLVTI